MFFTALYRNPTKSTQIHYLITCFPWDWLRPAAARVWKNCSQNRPNRARWGRIPHPIIYSNMCFLIRGHTMPGPRPDTLGRHGPKPSTTGPPDHQTVPTQAIFTPTCDVTKLRPPDDPVKRPHPCCYSRLHWATQVLGIIHAHTHVFCFCQVYHKEVYRSACNSRERGKTRKTKKAQKLSPIVVSTTQRVVLTRTHGGYRHNWANELYTWLYSFMPTATSMGKFAVGFRLFEVELVSLFWSIRGGFSHHLSSTNFATIPNMIDYPFPTPKHFHANKAVPVRTNILSVDVFHSMRFKRME